MEWEILSLRHVLMFLSALKPCFLHGRGTHIYSFKVMENRPDSQRLVARQSAEDCAICLDRILEKTTLKCLHSFCSGCIESSFKRKPACPVCNTFYGEYRGNQPEGTMTVTRSQQRLPGYERCGSIMIHYSFPAGIQGVSSTHTCEGSFKLLIISCDAVDFDSLKMLVWYDVWPLGGTIFCLYSNLMWEGSLPDINELNSTV